MIGTVPDHEPGDALNVCPSSAVPETAGGAVFVGGVEFETTTMVASEEAVDAPAEFEAVTVILMVEPTSETLSAYVKLVAANTSTQPVPDVLQRCH